MKRKLPIKIPDMVIILLAVGLCGFSAFTVYAKPRSTTQVYIEGQAQQWVFPLDAEETINVKGPLGITVVRIHGNEAWVESSPCENKVCVGAGHLHRNFEFAACLPNNVLVMIEGNDDNEGIDSTSR